MSLVFLLVIMGCASTKLVKGHNSENAYLVKCGNTVKAKCNAKATEMCPRGRRVLERNADRYDEPDFIA